MKVKYLEKGIPFDYKRLDKVREINLFRIWFSGNLLYGYKDEFNVVAISLEDVLSITE